MSSVLKKADKLNLSLSLSLSHWIWVKTQTSGILPTQYKYLNAANISTIQVLPTLNQHKSYTNLLMMIILKYRQAKQLEYHLGPFQLIVA